LTYILTLSLLIATVAAPQAPSSIDTSGWTTFRDATMGFEVKHPATWRVGRSTGTLEGILLGEPAQAGKERSLIQFFVQRDMNPKSLTIEQWYADQLTKVKGLPARTTNTVIGGRPTIRMENTGTLGRHFSFFTPINRIDIFTIAITQSSSPDALDPRYEAVLSTIKFLP